MGATRSAVLVALVVIVGGGLGLRLAYAAEGRDHLPPDSRVYAQIAENIYRDGHFDAHGPETPRLYQPTSAYSPGLPFFVAGIYTLTGGVHLQLARIVLALFGAASVLLTYFLGRRLAGESAGLVGAAAVAVYPALLEYQGLLLTEPLAAFLLVAAVLAYLQADDGGSPWWWAGAGALFGLLTLVRAEYLAIALLVPLLSIVRRRGPGLLRAARRPAVMILATLVVLAPWTIRNAIVVDRFVPVSTGGGKALYIGTNLDADGDGPKLRALLLQRYPGLAVKIEREGAPEDPNLYGLERLLAKLAADSHPDLDTDAALAELGRHQLHGDITDHPVDFAGLLVDKAYDTWTEPARGVMDEFPWRLLQLGLLLAALGGLAVLAVDRRFEALLLGLVLLYVTAVAALLIASPRRALIPLPLIAALAGTGLAWLFAFTRERTGAGAPRPT